MRVNEVMTSKPECVLADATLQEAAGKMKDLNVGVLPVCDNDRLVGMITDRDIATRATAAGRDPSAVHVRDAMTPEVTYVFDDQDASEAAKLMGEKQIRRLPVLNRDKRLVGIVSLGDLAVDAGDKKKAGEALKDISEPAKPRR
jgi:CBS domain-containing protein